MTLNINVRVRVCLCMHTHFSVLMNIILYASVCKAFFIILTKCVRGRKWSRLKMAAFHPVQVVKRCYKLPSRPTNTPSTNATHLHRLSRLLHSLKRSKPKAKKVIKICAHECPINSFTQNLEHTARHI